MTDPLNRVTSYTYDGNGNVLTVTDPANNVETMTYEPSFSRVTSTRDALNNVTNYTYDSHGNVTSVTDPLNHQTTIASNAFGQPTTITDPLSNVSALTYDAGGNLVSTTDPLGNTTTRGYDAVSRVVTQRDPQGMTTTIAYDALNRVTSLSDARGGVTSFSYDPNGNLLALTDARGNTTNYTYNSMDRMATRTDPLGHSENFVYDLAGNLSQHTNRKGQVATFTYDALDRRTGATYVDATVSYALDAVGRLTQVTDSIGGTITNAYDTLDRLTSQATSQGTLSYQYDVLGRRTQMTIPNQSAVTYAYDAASRLTSITQGSSVAQFAYDAANRRTVLTLPNGMSTQYGYNGASQLTTLTYQLGATTLGDLQYTYDAGGNRVQVGGSWARTGVPQAVASATYNANNQQLTFAGQNLSYDLNGNLTSDGTNTYTWDARNRLMAIGGTITASFAYDALGRRGQKTMSSVSTNFVYDGLNPVREQSGTAVTNLFMGLNTDEYIGRGGDPSSSAFFLTDSIGSIIALADNTGIVTTSYTYEPFGTTGIAGASVANPYEFTGRESDLPNLKFYRARYYHPEFQRFIAEDPAGFLGGWNHYEYVGNNPITFVDPRGLTRLEFNVSSGILTVDPERPGEAPYIIPATSGLDKCMNETKCEAIRGRGPIPRGAYYILSGEIVQPNAIWVLGWALRADWGSFRIPIHPAAGALVPGRDPSTFKLHGGRRPGSAGCIDVGGGLFGNQMTQRLLNDLRSDLDGRIPLIVK